MIVQWGTEPKGEVHKEHLKSTFRSSIDTYKDERLARHSKRAKRA